MNIEEVRDKALSLPFVTERQPYGPDSLVFEIGGKQFCLVDLTAKWQFYNLKVDPEYSLQLQESYASVRPGFHMNKKHWISLDYYGDVPDHLQYELIEHAYHQTIKGLPKKVRAEIEG
ncbi:MAG: MmcQ/YjbR family DNA-binding protein [Bacteroides sp.]|nr:MmcQ/YjbR family DNA-binding protein [Bacteroides sp.]MCM1085944.1 MmcQ/YjbR family DNA-binding protein [Bacteroides sp.]